MKIIERNKNLLNGISACSGDAARLAHALSETTDRLEALLMQAEAQFKAGDKHASFNKQTIESCSEFDNSRLNR